MGRPARRMPARRAGGRAHDDRTRRAFAWFPARHAEQQREGDGVLPVARVRQRQLQQEDRGNQAGLDRESGESGAGKVHAETSQPCDIRSRRLEVISSFLSSLCFLSGTQRKRPLGRYPQAVLAPDLTRITRIRPAMRRGFVSQGATYRSAEALYLATAHYLTRAGQLARGSRASQIHG